MYECVNVCMKHFEYIPEYIYESVCGYEYVNLDLISVWTKEDSVLAETKTVVYRCLYDTAVMATCIHI